MIIQHYEFSVRCNGALVFDGSTYFGFFHPEALAEQVGIREASPYVLTAAEHRSMRDRSRCRIGPLSRTGGGGWSSGSTPWSTTAARMGWG